MGIFDRFKSHASGEKGKKMSDAAEQKINEKTGNKYESQVDQAQRQAERRLGMDQDNPPGQQ
ncbi:antitoxin [Streptomyces sp. enrichment culture]|uniref:antitoxin n=1 Tax=Streptomyces sp. enrichment culture TaxID=1795815 RepID=UPI003F546531